MDQIVNNAAKIRYIFGGEAGCPLAIRTPGGGGNQLTAQHSQSFDAWFAHVPGLKAVTSARPADAHGLKSAIRDDDPVLFLENLPLYKDKGEVSEDADALTPIGRARVARERGDLTIVAHSYASCARCGSPSGWPTSTTCRSRSSTCARCARSTSTRSPSRWRRPRALCVEEGWSTYGITAELAARIHDACFDWLDAPVGRVGAAEVPMPYAKNLEQAALPGEGKIAAAARRVLGV
jgi:pyruvate dehydrogenase E1 component beta subunit